MSDFVGGGGGLGGGNKSFITTMGTNISARDHTGKALRSVRSNYRKTGAATKNAGRQMAAAHATMANSMRNVVHIAFSLYIAVMSLRSAFNYVEQVQKIENRFKLLTTSMRDNYNLQGRMLRMANETRQSYYNLAEVFFRLAKAGDGVGASLNEMAVVTKASAQATAVSGATSVEATNALRQFTQGIAANRLGGEELRAVLEQLPELGRQIAKGMGISYGQLRAYAKKGLVDTQAVKEAIGKQAGEIEDMFARTAPTVSQSFDVMRNAWVAFLASFERKTGAFRNFANIVYTTFKQISDSINPSETAELALDDLQRSAHSLWLEGQGKGDIATVEAIKNIPKHTAQAQKAIALLEKEINSPSQGGDDRNLFYQRAMAYKRYQELTKQAIEFEEKNGWTESQRKENERRALGLRRVAELARLESKGFHNQIKQRRKVIDELRSFFNEEGELQAQSVEHQEQFFNKSKDTKEKTFAEEKKYNGLMRKAKLEFLELSGDDREKQKEIIRQAAEDRIDQINQSKLLNDEEKRVARENVEALRELKLLKVDEEYQERYLGMMREFKSKEVALMEEGLEQDLERIELEYDAKIEKIREMKLKESDEKILMDAANAAREAEEKRARDDHYAEQEKELKKLRAENDSEQSSQLEGYEKIEHDREIMEAEYQQKLEFAEREITDARLKAEYLNEIERWRANEFARINSYRTKVKEDQIRATEKVELKHQRLQDDLLRMTQQNFGKHTAIAKAAFIIEKLRSVSTQFVNIKAGVASALAMQNYPGAAFIAALGAANIAATLATGFGGAGGSSSSSSGSAPSPSSPASVPAIGGASTLDDNPQRQVVIAFESSTKYPDDEVRKIATDIVRVMGGVPVDESGEILDEVET